MKFTMKKSECMKSDEERLGTCQVSNLTSMLACHHLGINADNLRLLNLEIEGIKTSLWSLIPMAVDYRKNKDKSVLEIIEKFKEQANQEVKSFIRTIDAITHDLEKDEQHISVVIKNGKVEKVNE